MNFNIENYTPIEVGNTVYYLKEGAHKPEVYGKVERIIDCIEEKFVQVDNCWININLVQKEAA